MFYWIFFWHEQIQCWNFTLFQFLGLWIFLEYDEQWDNSGALTFPSGALFIYGIIIVMMITIVIYMATAMAMG